MAAITEELEMVQEVWPYLMNLYNGETELTESELTFVLLVISWLSTITPLIVVLLCYCELSLGLNKESGEPEKIEDNNKDAQNHPYNQIAVPKQDYYRNITKYITKVDPVSCWA